MRVRLDVAASTETVDWDDVHGPARAVLYGLIGDSDAELARALHDAGWQGSSLRPVGISPPLFAGAPQRHGVYTTSKAGSVWLGSPVAQIGGALLRAAGRRHHLQWGGLRLAVRGLELEGPPDHHNGVGEFVTVSPVLVKKDGRFLLPDDDDFAERLTHNLRHKADVLGLPSDVTVDVVDSGTRRMFRVGGTMRLGAPIQARITGDPSLLDALYDWGLGLLTVQGFGWVR